MIVVRLPNDISLFKFMSRDFILSSKFSIDVAPIILLVTNGLLITNAFAKVHGFILYFFASFTYFFTPSWLTKLIIFFDLGG